MGNLSHWFKGIRGKLLLMVLFPTVLMTAIGVESLMGLTTAGNDLEVIANERIPITKDVEALRMYMNATLRFSWKALAQDDMAHKRKAIEDTHARMKDFDTIHDKLVKLHISTDSKKVLKDADEAWNDLRAAVEEGLSYLERDAANGSTQAHRVFIEKVDGPAARITTALKDLDELEEWRNGEIVQASIEEEHRIYRFVLFTIIAGSIALLAFGMWVASRLTRSLTTLSESLLGGSDQVASAAAQISSTSEELSSAATEQASSLEETASSVEEVRGMVKRNAESALQSKGVAGESHETATKGKQVVEDMIQAIADIDHANSDIMSQIEASNQQIGEITKVIAEIANKTKVINDIVFQTKLLSFNASVEAARAGEHGKGFAVVAEEVGNLAQMSGNAAKEISTMLEGSILKVQTIVEETKSRVAHLITLGKEKVAEGTKISRRCSEALDQIVNGAGKVTTLITDIANASEEQARGVDEIARAITQLDHVTQQNSAASQQAASAAGELSAQAESLRHSVKELMVTIDGGDSIRTTGYAVVSKASPSKTIKTISALAPKKTKIVHIHRESDVPANDDKNFRDVA